MTRGKPLAGAPGWRVVERRQPGPRRRPQHQPETQRRPEHQPGKRRASVTILAIAVGLLLIFAGTYRYRVGWPENRQLQFTAPTATTTLRASAPPTSEPAIARPEPAVPATPDPDPPGIAKPQRDVVAAPRRRGPAAPAGSLRIFIHYPAHRDDAVPAIRLAALLQTRGFPIVDIQLVEIEVEQPSVRYFFPEDRSDSRRLVDAIRTLLPREAPDQATDLSDFSPKPRPGTVELWLPADGPGPMAQDSPS